MQVDVHRSILAERSGERQRIRSQNERGIVVSSGTSWMRTTESKLIELSLSGYRAVPISKTDDVFAGLVTARRSSSRDASAIDTHWEAIGIDRLARI